jgi:cytochrome c-type protein NapC
MQTERRGFFARLKAIGPWTVLVIFAAGIVAWGGFNWTLEITNTEKFCTSCHVMEVNVFREYQNTMHYSNRTGVRATCPDCHVPREWVHKVARKVRASNEIYHWLLGSIDTREKFLAKRLKLAQLEWDRMRANDSRECRNCHAYDYMDYSEQGRRAVAQHTKGFAENKTCIDCHKGLAHQVPPMEQNIGSPRVANLGSE